ncbi:uncharacterized protein LOC126401090 [Xyrichtys novacula]|uniref:Uncharacterized protein LOC126401090 n=1 Tax=Xyrichtys novacula TaxID=13765 RepID=A0AAV1F9Q5_XYRNO|nr:uncharacterized protein LOC126401090 [Xyrichtys novacula]
MPLTVEELVLSFLRHRPRHYTMICSLETSAPTGCFFGGNPPPHSGSSSKDKIFELLRLIEEATTISDNIKRGEIHLLDFVFDVMLPELLIKALKEHGITRLRAEQMIACGSIF